MPETGNAETPLRITLTATPGVCEKFCLLTGNGFRIRRPLGCSVHELLCGQLGVEPEYLERRIQTIFLNGQVVDDPQLAVVSPGSTIALSAAMPGIAGAVLRKKSRYAPMRRELSCPSPDQTLDQPVEGDVVLKLFNLLQQELGPRFLRHGIQISGRVLRELLQSRWAAFQAGLVAADVSGHPVAPASLLEADWSSQDVVLVVIPQAGSTD